MSPQQQERAAPWVLLVAVLIAWEAVCRGFSISEFIFPAPSAIVAKLIELGPVIAGHAWRTFWVTMLGFSISIVVGMLLGFLIGSSRMAYAAMYPLMTGFNALPKAAFVPILVAITLAFVGTTVSEMTAANEGIGYLLISAGSSMQMGLAFAGLVVVGAMAMAMYELFAVIEKRTTAWAHRR